MSNISRFPMKGEDRTRHDRNARRIPCEVSPRYLQFHGGTRISEGRTFLSLDVMTQNEVNEENRKLCELILCKEDLLELLELVESDIDARD